MKARYWLMALLVFGLVVGWAVDAEADSRILWNTNNKAVVTARSFDWSRSDEPKIWIFPRGMQFSGEAGENSLKWTSKYGSIATSAWDVIESEGLNEKGLAAHVLYMKDSQYEKRDSRPGIGTTQWARYFLDNFATVKEAVAALETFQFVPTKVQGKRIPLHLALEDASGDSAIIEYVNGKMMVHHGKAQQVMTNDPTRSKQMKNLKRYKSFGGKEHLPGDVSSQDRFVRATHFLQHLPEPRDSFEAVAFAWSLIGNVAVPYGATSASPDTAGAYPTWWTSVTDLTNGRYYWHSTKSPSIIWVNLKQINFTKGQPVQNIDPRKPTLSGDVTKMFRKVTPSILGN